MSDALSDPRIVLAGRSVLLLPNLSVVLRKRIIPRKGLPMGRDTPYNRNKPTSFLVSLIGSKLGSGQRRNAALLRESYSSAANRQSTSRFPPESFFPRGRKSEPVKACIVPQRFVRIGESRSERVPASTYAPMARKTASCRPIRDRTYHSTAGLNGDSLERCQTKSPLCLKADNGVPNNQRWDTRLCGQEDALTALWPSKHGSLATARVRARAVGLRYDQPT